MCLCVLVSVYVCVSEWVCCVCVCVRLFVYAYVCSTWGLVSPGCHPYSVSTAQRESWRRLCPILMTYSVVL